MDAATQITDNVIEVYQRLTERLADANRTDDQHQVTASPSADAVLLAAAVLVAHGDRKRIAASEPEFMGTGL